MSTRDEQKEALKQNIQAAQKEVSRRLGDYREDKQKKATLPNLAPEPKSDATAPPEPKQTQLKRHLFFRLLSYLPGYEAALQLHVIPAKFLRVSKLFVSGAKLLFADMKSFMFVHDVLSMTRAWERACKTLSLRQLELYDSLPAAMMRVGPVIVLSALPMAQYVVFPVALLFPKKLLSDHFWTPEQVEEVASEKLKHKHAYYRPLFRDMQMALRKLDEKDTLRKKQILAVFAKLTSTQQPTTDEILSLRPLFEAKGVFHLSQVKSLHVRHLLRLHGRSGWFGGWRVKLQQYGNLLHQMDLALLRERDTLSQLELRASARRRGLNVDGLTEAAVREYLDRWCEVSLRLDSDTNSLLLHLPVLLGYNHENRHWDDGSVH